MSDLEDRCSGCGSVSEGGGDCRGFPALQCRVSN